MYVDVTMHYPEQWNSTLQGLKALAQYRQYVPRNTYLHGCQKVPLSQHILSECLSLWQDLTSVCVFAFRRCVYVVMHLGKHASVKTWDSEVNLISRGAFIYRCRLLKRNAENGSAVQCG